VKTVKVGDFVVGGFASSDNTLRDLPGRLSRPLRPRFLRARHHRHAVGVRPDPAGRRHPGGHAWPRLASRTRNPSRRCSPHPMCSAPAGSPPSPPKPDRARPSLSSVTGRSASWASWPPSSSARSESSPCRATPKPGARAFLRGHRDRGGARRRRRRAHHGADEGTRCPLRDRGGRHLRVDDAGDPLDPPGRACRVCRGHPRRPAAWRRAVLQPGAPARRTRTGPSTPAAPSTSKRPVMPKRSPRVGTPSVSSSRSLPMRRAAVKVRPSRASASAPAVNPSLT
jgi:hypothetical protein